ncbi:MAG TPA: hypothetical protein VLJ59_05435 [Mycobacteriales bacterium]|nr:hypothetical protein [Mycobacteriales bacterium]
MLRQIHAEQIKLTTLRSTWWTTATTLTVSLASALLIAANVNGTETDAVGIITILLLVAAQLAHIAVMVMAVIVSTSEYRFGQIRMTFAATPRRWQVLLAKAVVTVVAAFVIGTATAWLCVLLAKPLLPAEWHLDLAADGAQRVVWGLALFFAASALLALSVGAILRNSPAAITILALLSLAVEKTLLAVPKTRDFAQYLPFNAGARITQPIDPDTQLSPWGGFTLFCVYAVVLFVVAVIMTEARDA